MHEHGNTHIVDQSQGWSISKQGIPQLQDTGKRELTTKQQPNPTTGEGGRERERGGERGEGKEGGGITRVVINRQMRSRQTGSGNDVVKTIDGQEPAHLTTAHTYVRVHVRTCRRSVEGWRAP